MDDVSTAQAGAPEPDGEWGPSEAPADRDQMLDQLEQQLGRLARRIRRVVGERAAAVHPELQPAAYMMLALVLDRGSLRPSEVAEFFEIDKGSISRQVQQLVDLGLVEKVRDPDDGRAVVLSPTADGRRRMEEVIRLRRVRYNERLGDWPDEEVHALVALLTRYNAALD